MSNLFDQLKAVTDLPHGWTSFEKAKALTGIVFATRPHTVVEIGVWSGKSLISMALACKDVGAGKCYGIDPFEASASVIGQTGANAEWWSKQEAHEHMLGYFQRQVIAFGVSDVVEHVRDLSDNVNVNQWDAINLLHIDGNHGPQALKDAQRFAPKIPVGGFAVLDDLNWQDGGVSQAVDYLLSAGFIEHFRLKKEGNDWGVFQRVKASKK